MIEIGKKYGKLTCIETYGSTSLFKCDCEKEVVMQTALDRPVSPSNNQYSWGKVDENI